MIRRGSSDHGQTVKKTACANREEYADRTACRPGPGSDEACMKMSPSREATQKEETPVGEKPPFRPENNKERDEIR